jgi:3-methylcrotonyl-CoA carboxylase alpha subunit
VTVFDKYGIRFDVIDALDVVTEVVEDGDFIEAPMPGLIKSMFVSLGDKVSKGDRLAILEAMKMEHSLSASRNGTVVEVLANSGDQVIAGAALVRLEDET